MTPILQLADEGEGLQRQPRWEKESEEIPHTKMAPKILIWLSTPSQPVHRGARRSQQEDSLPVPWAAGAAAFCSLATSRCRAPRTQCTSATAVPQPHSTRFLEAPKNRNPSKGTRGRVSHLPPHSWKADDPYLCSAGYWFSDIIFGMCRGW